VNSLVDMVLSNENVDTICCIFQNFNDVEKYIKLSGTRLELPTKAILNDFKSKLGRYQCRIGCNICEEYCPQNIPINTIMRYNYYYTSKGQEKSAMQKYSELPGGKPDVCLTCEGFCEKACPYGVLTRPLLTIAHHNLSIDSPKFS